jgi:hypothetical protein
MKNILSFLVFSLICIFSSVAPAENMGISGQILNVDYIVINAVLQNFDSEAEIDGLKVNIYYMNRRRDQAISWEWVNTKVTYSILKSRAGQSDKDSSILSGYERISSSGDILYIRLSRQEHSYGNGTLLVTVQFPDGSSFSAKKDVRLSP